MFADIAEKSQSVLFRENLVSTELEAGKEGPHFWSSCIAAYLVIGQYCGEQVHSKPA